MIADMSLNATSWRRRRRFTTSLRPSQSSLHALFLKCGLFACSALNARSNDCHVGLLCMTQRAQYRTQMWVRTRCVVVRTDFLCYPLHFQHKKLNSPWRCSRVPVRADPLRVYAYVHAHLDPCAGPGAVAGSRFQPPGVARRKSAEKYRNRQIRERHARGTDPDRACLPHLAATAWLDRELAERYPTHHLAPIGIAYWRPSRSRLAPRCAARRFYLEQRCIVADCGLRISVIIAHAPHTATPGRTGSSSSVQVQRDEPRAGSRTPVTATGSGRTAPRRRRARRTCEP